MLMKVDKKIFQNEICRRDLSVADFAEKAGVRDTQIYNILHGGKSQISTVGKIALALGMDFTELIEGAPPPSLLREIIRQGCSIKSFAKKAGIRADTLTGIITGRRQWRVSTKMKILSALCLK